MFSFKDLRYFVLIATLGAVAFLYHQNQKLKAENIRKTHNYNTALKIDSLEVAVFKVKTATEIKDLLKQNTALNKLVHQSQVKTKRIQSLYYQKLEYIDSVQKRLDVTPLVKNIRKNITATQIWKDSTACSIIKGNVRYSNDSLQVNVTKKQFNNNTVLLHYKGRRRSIKWLFGLRLGARENVFKPQTKCGTNKVTIIKKEQ